MDKHIYLESRNRLDSKIKGYKRLISIASDLKRKAAINYLKSNNQLHEKGELIQLKKGYYIVEKYTISESILDGMPIAFYTLSKAKKNGDYAANAKKKLHLWHYQLSSH